MHSVRKRFYDHEEEEQWLNEMCAKGFACKSVENKYTYIFEDIRFVPYIYRVEYGDRSKGYKFSGFDNKVSTVGVEIINTGANRRILRQKASEGAFDMYTEPSARVNAYRYIMFELSRVINQFATTVVSILSVCFAYCLIYLNADFLAGNNLREVFRIIMYFTLAFGGLVLLISWTAVPSFFAYRRYRRRYRELRAEMGLAADIVIYKRFYDFEREEKWLNELSARGLALVLVEKRKYRKNIYIFNASELGEYVYRTQYNIKIKVPSPTRDYPILLKDAGVDTIHTDAQWSILRRKASDGEFELYTDNASRREAYRAVVRTVFKSNIVLLVLIVCTLMMVVGLVASSSASAENAQPLKWNYALMPLWFIYNFIKDVIPSAPYIAVALRYEFKYRRLKSEPSLFE